ncbi:MAG: DUF167 domain-containing protein [Armatimonadota bacterium]
MPEAILKVRVNPRSSRNQVTGWKDGVLCVKITAPPVDGAANKACVEYISDLLGVRKSQVSIISGDTGRDKVFKISDMSSEVINQRLSSL